MIRHILPLLLLALAVCCCTHRRPTPIPRQTAYPRPALYAAEYKPVTAAGLDSLMVNGAAVISEPQPGWLDICYPAYNITLNTTVSRADIPAVLANRAQRMDLNIEQTGADMEQFISRSGLHVTLLVAPEALRTPLQFLATDSALVVFSGAAVANFPANAPADSVSPIIDAVAADLRQLLRSL